MNLLPEFLDGVGDVFHVDAGDVADVAVGVVGSGVVGFIPALEGLTGVGRHASLRVPPVVARPPRQIWW